MPAPHARPRAPRPAPGAAPARSVRPSDTERLDLRDPWIIGLRELGRRPGSALPVQRAAAFDDRLGLELIGVVPGSVVEADLLTQSASEGVLVTGTVRAQAGGECGRCLEPIHTRISTEIVELFAYPDSLTEQTTDEDEIYRVQIARDGTEAIDVEPIVRDAIVLDLPMTPLCRPDCEGLCAECGLPFADLPDDHAHDVIDARFAALASLHLVADAGDVERRSPEQSTDSDPSDHRSSTKE